MDGVKKKIADLNQQIAVNLKRKNKAYKYIKKIHENSPHKGNKLRIYLTLDDVCNFCLELFSLVVGKAIPDVLVV